MPKYLIAVATLDIHTQIIFYNVTLLPQLVHINKCSSFKSRNVRIIEVIEICFLNSRSFQPFLIELAQFWLRPSLVGSAACNISLVVGAVRISVLTIGVLTIGILTIGGLTIGVLTVGTEFIDKKFVVLIFQFLLHRN
jgi:hypothetical protein